MLNSLKNKDISEQERVLASITQYLLPRPTLQSSNLTQVEQLTLSEICNQLKVDPNDLSPKVRARIFKFLTDEMVKPLRESHKWKQARFGLGESGDLCPDLYKIEFVSTFSRSEAIGIRKSRVEDALRKPDSVEHLSFNMDTKAVSIYLKHFRAFSLLSIAHREGDRLFVDAAFRMYHSDVKHFSISSTPTSMFTLFAETYGVPLTVANKIRGKLLINEVYPYVGGNIRQVVTVDRSFIGDKGLIGILAVYRIHYDLGVISISMAYGIDLAKYTLDLRKHNLLIDFDKLVYLYSIR